MFVGHFRKGKNEDPNELSIEDKTIPSFLLKMNFLKLVVLSTDFQKQKHLEMKAD